MSLTPSLRSVLQITLAANKSEFQEFSFLSRRAIWVKFMVQKVYGSSGGVGIQEIEIYNKPCTQSMIFKVVCEQDHSFVVSRVSWRQNRELRAGEAGEKNGVEEIHFPLPHSPRRLRRQDTRAKPQIVNLLTRKKSKKNFSKVKGGET